MTAITSTTGALTSLPPILNCSNINQLSEFVSQMVPKIWNNNNMTVGRLNGFQLFCKNIIKSTQISSSCIIVALFYIYRLRFAYPAIRGSIGSEVRLFTTALVLANKFLDDNTFTNKTWAEVSSIPLRELNIMEMEFLSALNYKTCIHHLTFYSWTTQCQFWMSQLLNTTSTRQPSPSLSHQQQLRSPLQHLYPQQQQQQQQPRKRSAGHFMSDEAATIKKRATLYYTLSSGGGFEGSLIEGGGGIPSWSSSAAASRPTMLYPAYHQYHYYYQHQQDTRAAATAAAAASAVVTVAAAAVATMNNVNNLSNTTTTNNNNNNNFIPRRV